MFKFDPLAKIRKWLTTSKTVSTEGKYFADAKSIKDLYDAIKWKTLGSVTGKTTSISLPSSYNELYVWGVDSQTSCIMGGIIPNGVMGNQIVINGHYISSSYNSELGVRLNSSEIKMNECYINGIDRTSTTTITVLYR